MNADATQGALPLSWFLAALAAVGLIVTVVWLADGWATMRRADDLHDVFDTDDPHLYGTDDEAHCCTDPTCGCEQGRAMYDGYVRLSRALAEHGEWEDRLRAVARADAEAAWEAAR